MSYKNDGHLVIANRFGSASSDAKVMLYETYDRLRDLTVAGSAGTGTGFEAAGGFLYQLASLFAPSAFMSTLGGTNAMNIPGTSYWTQYTGGNGGGTGTYSSFGVNTLGNFSGFPSGYAANYGYRQSGYATGGASSIGDLSVETEAGSVAVLCITSTCDDAARAGDAGHKIPARPGVNMLRHSETFAVNAAHMKALEEIAAATHINGRINNSKRGGYTVSKPGVFNLSTLEFVQDTNEGKRSAPHPQDMARMKTAVETAKKMHDYVVVCFHSHEIKGDLDEEPDYFIEQFARACIDWGADAVVGSGTHQIKAIELYRGRPIFYSIANFIFQSEKPAELPSDYHDRYGIDRSKTAAEALFIRSAGGTRGLETEFKNYKGLVPMLEFDGDTLKRILIKPVELGFYHEDKSVKGLPHNASESVTEEILTTLQELSAPYGTRLARTNGFIEVILT